MLQAVHDASRMQIPWLMRAQPNRFYRQLACLLLACCLPLAGSAAAPPAQLTAANARSDVLLAEQIEQLRLGDPASPVLAVFAMHSESMAFEGDADLTVRTARAHAPKGQALRVLRLGNGAGKRSVKNLFYPLATRDSIARALAAIAQHSSPQTPVTLLFTSHGNEGLLGINIAERNYPAVRAADLAAWLAPLAQRPTLVLLSACYSGSLIPAVAAPHRIVLTAASADRSSFGCNFNSRNTFFIEELLGPVTATSVGFEQHVRDTWMRIAQREKELNYGPPSNPQMSVGEQMAPYAASPWTQWWSGASAATSGAVRLERNAE